MSPRRFVRRGPQGKGGYLALAALASMLLYALIAGLVFAAIALVGAL